MKSERRSRNVCSVCGHRFDGGDLVPASVVSDAVAELIRAENAEWSSTAYICRADLARYRARYVHALLESEKGELTELEREVLDSLRQHEILATDIEREFEQKWTLGERVADRVAGFGGSWTFLMLFAAFIVLWIAMNSVVLYWRPADPYPFILLNLLLSCLAAVQAPIIMMSQNRQEAKDRLRSQHDYQINLKAELEIRHLNEKVDHLLSHQWERLVQIQEVQLELLSELERKGSAGP